MKLYCSTCKKVVPVKVKSAGYTCPFCNNLL